MCVCVCVCVAHTRILQFNTPQFRSIQSVINNRKSEGKAGSLLTDQMASLLFYLLILLRRTTLQVPLCQFKVLPRPIAFFIFPGCYIITSHGIPAAACPKAYMCITPNVLVCRHVYLLMLWVKCVLLKLVC